MKTEASLTTNSMNLSPVRLAFLLIPFVSACFALSPQARAACQQGCDLSNFSTFLGDGALVNNTGASNTAVGSGALTSNTGGSQNTAIGVEALSSNTAGIGNTASGFQALRNNIDGFDNTAAGLTALIANTTGNRNTASGSGALALNTSGNANTATGSLALEHNTTGDNNIAVGFGALISNMTGNNNIAVGALAGFFTRGSNNIEIGHRGFAGDSGTIRIGTTGTQSATFIAGISGVTVPNGVGVIVGPNGKLGTVVSSARFKEAIKPMDKASEAILALQPVTFCYKQELDPDSIPQFGLVAEEVEKVNPDLVAHDDDGRPYSVRYEAVNAMLLNEFLKEHRRNQEQEATIRQFKSAIIQQASTNAAQQREIETLKAALKEQAAQIQQVSAQLAAANPSRGGLETTKQAQQIVLNNQ